MFVNRKKQASALIISVAILSVLALLAISFARLMVIERDGSKNHSLQVEAGMAATAGVEYAVAWFSDPTSIEPAYSLASVSAPWIFQNDAGTDVGAGMCEVEEATNPSFESSDDMGWSLEIDSVDPRRRSFSRLKVIDTASQINLNGPVWDDGGVANPSSLRRLLKNLGTAIAYMYASTPPAWWPAGEDVPDPLPQDVVDDIVDRRSGLLDGQDWPDGAALPDDFQFKEEVRDLVEAGGASDPLTAAQKANVWRLVKDHLAVQGWKNERAVRSRSLLDDLYPSSSNILSNGWWNRTPHVWGRKTADLEDVTPRLEARYPINVNTAGKPVLMAVFLGVAGIPSEIIGHASKSAGSDSAGTGLWMKRWRRRVVSGGFEVFSPIGDLATSRIEALANAIISYRTSTGPIDDWAEFRAFLRTFGDPNGSNAWFDEELQHLILANASPDLMSSDRMVCPQRDLKVDKFALSRHTTDLCFGPMGYFEIQSLGWVEDTTGKILASTRIDTLVQVWEVGYLGSQRDFERSKTGSSHAVSGPEPTGNLASTAALGNVDLDPLLDRVYGSLDLAADGNPYEGWIMAHSQNDPTAGSNPTFVVPFSTNFDATTAAGGSGTASGYGAQNPDGSATTHDNNWKNTGYSSFLGEALAPDGVLCGNYSDELLSYPATHTYGTENFNPFGNTIEFWMQLPAGYDPARDDDPAKGPVGAHEAIMYLNQQIGTVECRPNAFADANGDGINDNPSVWCQVWIIWKLERYGKKLRSTRFMALSNPKYPYPGYNLTDQGSGVPGQWRTLSHYPAGTNDYSSLTWPSVVWYNQDEYKWTETAIRLDDLYGDGTTTWRDGEWHHIVVSWDEFTKQALYVDGVRVAAIWGRNAPYTMLHEGLDTFGLNEDNTPGVYYELVSAPLEQKLFVGGLIFQKGSSTLAILRGQDDSVSAGQNVIRMANCKIDDIRSYPWFIPATTRSSTTYSSTYYPAIASDRAPYLWPRYRCQPSGTPYFAFSAPAARNGRLALVTFNTIDSFDTSVSMSYSVTANSTTLASDTGSDLIDSDDAGETPILVAAGDDIEYRIEFNVGSGTNASPIVESVMTYLVIPPVYASYGHVLSR